MGAHYFVQQTDTFAQWHAALRDLRGRGDKSTQASDIRRARKLAKELKA